MTARRGKALVALVVVAVAGRGAGGGAGAAGPRRGFVVGLVPPPASVTLRIGWTADPDNLSPFIGVETATSEVLYLTYDRLFGFGLDGKPIPQLATELPDARRTAASRPTASPGRSTSGRA